MKTSGHTPGPWTLPHFAAADSNCACEYVFGERQDIMGAVASVHYSSPSHNFDADNPRIDEAIANAHLISAAPDLLFALKLCADELESIHVQHGDLHNAKAHSVALAAALAAIAKTERRP